MKPSRENRIRLMKALEEYGLDGVRWDEVWQTRVRGQLQGTSLNRISLEMIIKNKEAVGRTNDLDDLQYLKRLAEKRKQDEIHRRADPRAIRQGC